MRRRFASLILLCAGLAGFPLRAQSYQTSFSDVKFDRAKGPATFTGGVEVDAATGAASMTIPFGPGIGERGIKFRPVLSMRIAPQLRISSVDENLITNYWFGDPSNPMVQVQTEDTLYQSSFGSASFSPGTLDLASMVTTLDRKKTTYSLPGGSGGRTGGVGTGLTVDQAQALLTKFGFTANDAIGYRPGPVGRTSKTPLLDVGTTGALVVGLRTTGPVDSTTQTTDEVRGDIQQYPSSVYRWDFPRRMVVIQGEVAYEYHYVNHNYTTRYIPYLAISQKTQLNSAHYLLTKIRNKFGENIAFTYDADGIGYTAVWSTNPNVKIRVAVAGTAAAPSGSGQLMHNRFGLSQVTQIRVTYQGISQPVSGDTLEVSDPSTGGAVQASVGGGPGSLEANAPEGQIMYDTMAWDAAVQTVQPVRVVHDLPGGNSEQTSFAYGAGPSTTWGDVTVTPTVLTSVTMPTRVVTLQWQAYPFRMNYNPDAWGGILSSVARCRPAYTYGVTRISDRDPNAPNWLERVTTHHRVIPTSIWGYYQTGTAPADQWVDTHFYDVITHPDGTVDLHKFVSPPPTNTSVGADGMQNLAFIKTVECEVRYYGDSTSWSSDLAVTSPANSSAFKWVVKDRFDTLAIGGSPVPYPTRIRTWDKESQIFTVEETADPDWTAYGWKTVHRTSAIQSSPSMTMDYRSLAQQGQAYAVYPTTLGVYQRENKIFDPKPSEWIFARVKTDQITTIQDNTGFLAPGVLLPDAQPLLTKTFNPSINRVDTVSVAGSDGQAVTTSFTFQGTAGLSATELSSAYLTSPGLGLSGQLGVSAYGYDANGSLSSISQKPNASTILTAQQTQDELGQPTTQTDMTGTVKTISWDAAGRLSSIISSDGDVSTSIAYNDSDHRGITVTRGAQISEYRYNAFGELILERRRASDGTWSYRIYGRDTAGRQTGETVWQPGDGASHEWDWTNPNLVRSSKGTSTTPERTICRKYGLDVDGNAICIQWQTIPATTVTWTTAALYAGFATDYDIRGRVIRTQDANGIQTTTDYYGPGTLPPGVGTYVGLVRKVTVGGSETTWYESDAAGRLVRVTTPVTRNLVITYPHAEYRYDGANRIGEVKQFDESGRVQTRSWIYNRLGWLTGLVQPESGATSYSGFTVAGKPTITSYNGRIVRMSPDWMGRPLTVTSDDGTVSQAFAYDAALNGQGRLASSADGSISTAYSYGGQGKRLDSLITTALVQGASQSFTQTFTYDTYGNRTGGNTSHGAWAQTYDAASGLPTVLSYGSSTVASTPWSSYDPVSWAIRTIAYGNGVHSDFTYDADQTRLLGVTHSPSSGGPLAQWTYTYDQLTGNLIWENDLLTGSFDQYGFDEMNRLISALVQSPTYGDQLQQFDYDAFGNRISSSTNRVTGWSSGTRGAGTATVAPTSVPTVMNVTLNQADSALWQRNQLPSTTSAGSLTGAVYDAQGNLTQIFEKPGDASKSVTMAYDALGRVASLSSSRTGITEKYQYTAEGLRTVAQEYIGTTLQKTRVNLYNDGRRLVSQYEKLPSGSLTWKRDITYLGTRDAAEFDSTGMHVTMVDHLGSPRIVTGATGQVETRQKYLPYGELLEQSGTFKTAKGYTNHEQTDTSGLIYMQARFYLPWFGRFTSPDPARDQHFEDTQSWNIYSYVRNSPIMITDPTGMVGEGNVFTAGTTVSYNYFDTIVNDENKKMTEKAQTKKPTAEEISRQVPNEVKKAILNALKTSNSPSGDDKKGGYHEEGGMWGPSDTGGLLVIPAKPGPYSKQGDKTATVDEGIPADPKMLEHSTGELGGKYHIHPKGGGDYGFVQPPFDGDHKNASPGINIVVGAENRMVYFYDSSGTFASMGLSRFLGDVK